MGGSLAINCYINGHRALSSPHCKSTCSSYTQSHTPCPYHSIGWTGGWCELSKNDFIILQFVTPLSLTIIIIHIHNVHEPYEFGGGTARHDKHGAVEVKHQGSSSKLKWCTTIRLKSRPSERTTTTSVGHFHSSGRPGDSQWINGRGG